MNVIELLNSDSFSYAQSEALPDTTDENYAEFTI